MDYIAYIIIAPVACFVIILTFAKIWPFRSDLISRPLLWFLGSIAFLLLFNIAELVVPTPELTILFRKMQHPFYHGFSVAWLLFAFYYAGLERYINKPGFFLYLLLPFASILAVFTNEYHQLFWTNVSYVQIFGLLTMQVTYGPFFWVTMIFLFLLLISGVFIIAGININGPALYRKQSRWMISGVMFPLIFNFLYIFRLFPFLQKDFSPVAFAIAGMLFYWGIYKHRLLKILPQSRGNIIQALKEGVLVLDLDLRIVDFNKAAQEYFDMNDEILGSLITDLPIGKMFLKESIGTLENTHKLFFQNRWLRIKEQSYSDRSDKVVGQVLIIEDITEEQRLTQELNVSKNQLRSHETFAAIGQISSGIAHEIKNPLSYVFSGFRGISLILEKNIQFLDEKDQKDLKIILEDSFDGLNIIQRVVQNMLTLSRQKTKEKQPFLIHETLQTALNILGSEYTFQYNLQCDKSLEILGNKDSFMQICLNIVRNGIQSWNDLDLGTQSQPRIDLHAFKENELVFVDFQNNGPPIPAEMVPSLFKPLFTTKENGTGLGLAISKNLASTFADGNLQLISNDPVCFRFQTSIV